MRRTGFKQKTPAQTAQDRLNKRIQKQLLEEARTKEPVPRQGGTTGWPKWFPRALWHYPWVLTEREWDGTLVDWAFKLGGCRKTFHDGDSSQSNKGWFDRVFVFPHYTVFAELKIRYANGSANTLSVDQEEFLYYGALGGLDVRAWLWPDDCQDAWETLTRRPWAECPYAQEVSNHAPHRP